MCCIIHKADTIQEWQVIHELRKMEALIKNDQYEALAAELQAMLQLSWDEATRESIEQALLLLEDSGDVTEADLEGMVDFFRDELAESYAKSIETQITGMIGNIYNVSVAEIVAGIASDNEPVVKWLQDHHMYWIGNHYDQQVQERIVKAGTEVLEQGLSRQRAGDVFKEAFQGEFNKSQSYWEGLSNHITTRSREFGRIDGYQQEGTERYEISAVRDDRTSEICVVLDGTIIDVSAAVEQRDMLINASNPEEVKEIAPWVKPGQIVDSAGKVLSQEKLANLGVLIPPFHFNCRTRTLAL